MTVRWGVLSTAAIGKVVVNALGTSDVARFVAVASRDGAKAAAFAAEVGLGRSWGSYEQLLADDEVDAVYISLPVSMHTEWTLETLRAGKHVLCEKPFATRAADAEGSDLRLAATLTLPGDALAQFDVALDYPRRDELEVVGTEGRLRLPDPWLCRLGCLELERGGTFERLPADPEGRYGLGDPADPDNDDAYRIELEAVSAAIEGSATAGFGRTDAVDQAAVIEAVRSAATTGTVVRPPGTAPGICPA